MVRKMSDNTGHRGRMTASYLKRGRDAYEDYQLLEMVLFYVIDRKDVKPIAKALLKDFGSLEKVFSASPDQLIQTKGVGPKTAALIKLFDDVSHRLIENRVENYTVIKSCDDAVKCFKEMYMLEKENERLAVMCLDNSNGIINCRFVAEGTVNAMEISIRKIIELVLSFNSSAVVIAHNHPHGKAQPSMEDINFTLNLRNMLNSLSINLVDHVIIGENEVISMRSSLDYINKKKKDNK